MYLGIETSSAVSSVAVMDEQRFIGELTVQAGLTHSEQLVPHIDLLLKQSGVAKTALKGITVSIGPGSFTGLRIGMGTAKALAYALNIPLMGVMTMDGLAHNFWQFSGVLAVMVDAQKKNVYEGRYRWAAGQLVCEQAPTVKTRDEALKALGSKIGENAERAATLVNTQTITIERLTELNNQIIETGKRVEAINKTAAEQRLVNQQKRKELEANLINSVK